MSSNFESFKPDEEELTEQNTHSSEYGFAGQQEQLRDEESSINDYFDDGFGDELPNQISLESEDDIKTFERAYNIDFKSYLEKRDMAA